MLSVISQGLVKTGLNNEFACLAIESNIWLEGISTNMIFSTNIMNIVSSTYQLQVPDLVKFKDCNFEVYAWDSTDEAV